MWILMFEGQKACLASFLEVLRIYRMIVVSHLVEYNPTNRKAFLITWSEKLTSGNFSLQSVSINSWDGLYNKCKLTCVFCKPAITKRPFPNDFDWNIIIKSKGRQFRIKTKLNLRKKSFQSKQLQKGLFAPKPPRNQPISIFFSDQIQTQLSAGHEPLRGVEQPAGGLRRVPGHATPCHLFIDHCIPNSRPVLTVTPDLRQLPPVSMPAIIFRWSFLKITPIFRFRF